MYVDSCIRRGIYTVKDCFKKKVWLSVKLGELYMIGVNGGGLRAGMSEG